LFDRITENGFSWPSTALAFERVVELGERQRQRVRLEGLEGLEEDRIRDHADLDALEILALRDRTLAVRDVAKAEVPERERDEPLLGQLRGQLLAERAVEHRVGLLVVADDERKVDEAELLDDADQRGGGRRRHLLDAALQRRLLLHLVAELARGNSLTVILPPLFAVTSSVNFLTPMLTGWSVLFRWPKRIVRSWMSCARACIVAHASTATRRPQAWNFLLSWVLRVGKSVSGSARSVCSPPGLEGLAGRRERRREMGIGF
jgi:hypothetical protein